MRSFTKYDLFWVLRDFAVFAGKTSSACKSVQSFRVWQKDIDIELGTPNLGARNCDKQSPFFFSRKWQKEGYPEVITFDYPLLNVYPGGTTISKRDERGNISADVTFEVSVIDTLAKDWDKLSCEGCAGRTPLQIRLDCEDMLFTLINYLGSVKLYQIDNCNDLVAYNEDVLLWLHANGHVNSYVEQSGKTILSQASVDSSMNPISFAAKGLYGSFITISFSERANCEQFILDGDQRPELRPKTDCTESIPC